MRATALVCVLLPLACSSHHDGGGSMLTALTLSPGNSTLVLQDGSAATESFTATATFGDGTMKDVTAEVQFGIDETLGAFTGADLTMYSAGTTTVTGLYSDPNGSASITGTAQVSAELQGIRVDPSLPSTTPNLFGSGVAEDPARAPTVVYPPAGVIVPRNLGDFEVHWTDASSNNVYEVSLEGPNVDLKIYVPGGNGSGGGPDPSWTAFLASEWMAAIGSAGSLTYQVRGADSTMPGTVGSAPPQGVDLSNETLNGGIYYWTTGGSASPEGIWRHDMAKPQQPATAYETLTQTNGRCIACHVLSADGTKMAITYDGGNGKSDQLDVASQAFQGDANAWNFGTYTPDGAQFLAVEAGNLVVRDQATQTVLGMMTSAGWVTHPSLSPDGTMLVYTRPTVTNCDWAFGGGQIIMRTYDQATLAFGPEITLVANGNNNYYPSFSPDGQWVLFNQSTDNTTSGAYNNPSATVWVVKADPSGTATAIELTNANTTVPNLTNSWGRWAPFQQTIGVTDRPMYWVTFSSKRDFGVRLVGAARPQLWMTPFFPDQAMMGMDPSGPAFWLPFQNIDSSNHIAQWTQQVIGIE